MTTTYWLRLTAKLPDGSEKSVLVSTADVVVVKPLLEGLELFGSEIWLRGHIEALYVANDPDEVVDMMVNLATMMNERSE